MTLETTNWKVYRLLQELENLGFTRSESVEILRNDDTDFEFGTYRFISEEVIDETHHDELTSDEYMMGCFNPEFIARHLGLPVNVITTLQKAEAFEGIGEMILAMGKSEEMMADYASVDGYGHHFAHYDHETHELSNGYYAFRIN